MNSIAEPTQFKLRKWKVKANNGRVHYIQTGNIPPETCCLDILFDYYLKQAGIANVITHKAESLKALMLTNIDLLFRYFGQLIDNRNLYMGHNTNNIIIMMDEYKKLHSKYGNLSAIYYLNLFDYILFKVKGLNKIIINTELINQSISLVSDKFINHITNIFNNNITNVKDINSENKKLFLGNILYFKIYKNFI